MAMAINMNIAYRVREDERRVREDRYARQIWLARHEQPTRGPRGT